MKRLGYVLGLAALTAISLSFLGEAAGRFDQRLSADKEIVHVLNRLTFGARPADIAEIRRLAAGGPVQKGIDKWIDLQLHPERIAENPVLEAKLKPLDTLKLSTWQIVEKYQQPAQPQASVFIAFPNSSLTPLQRSKLQDGGTVEERRAVIASLQPDVRAQLLASAAPQILEGLDEYQQEAAKARQARTDAALQEARRQNPPINELLTQDQVRTGRQGTKDEKLALINSLDPMKRRQVLRALGPGPFNDLPELRREVMGIQQFQQLVNSDLIENKLYRAIYSNRQLEEVMVDFWMNHFNVYNGKGQDRVLLTGYERDAIRPNALGHFRDLLLATARHPAMLLYLDNFQSRAPREDLPAIGPNGLPLNRPGLNENYGRELMELHTLGVNGGYEQQDVIAVARALTGWTIYDQAKYAEFHFDPNMHDRNEKVILGHTLPAHRGEQDGLEVIDILARHPSTAKFISKKLAQRFVSDDPPQTLMDRMADTFTKTDGDIRAVLQTLFSSVEFSSEGAWQAKMKSPLEFAVSAVRASNAEPSDVYVLAQRIADLGEPLYGKLEPTGYPNTGEAWANTSSILGRINFATALTAGQIPGLKVDFSRLNFKPPAAVAGELLGIAPSAATLSSIEKGIQGKEATPSMLTSLVISSPEFQRR
jgi:uncharacterized protein (DUF1800 family)